MSVEGNIAKMEEAREMMQRQGIGSMGGFQNTKNRDESAAPCLPNA